MIYGFTAASGPMIDNVTGLAKEYALPMIVRDSFQAKNQSGGADAFIRPAQMTGSIVASGRRMTPNGGAQIALQFRLGGIALTRLGHARTTVGCQNALSELDAYVLQGGLGVWRWLLEAGTKDPASHKPIRQAFARGAVIPEATSITELNPASKLVSVTIDFPSVFAKTDIGTSIWIGAL